MGLPSSSRETKLSGTHGDRGIFIFPVQLSTSRIGNLTRLILTLAICDMTIPTHIILGEGFRTGAATTYLAD